MRTEGLTMAENKSNSQLQVAIFRALREMDEEALPTSEGLRTGLYWYCLHEYAIHPERRKKRHDNERAWCRRLREVLPANHGFAFAETDQRYPGNSRICDLVVGTTSGDRIWIEVKGAWKYDWNWPTPTSQAELYPNPAYYKHLISDLRESTVLDFGRLAALRRADATAVAVLLLGFDVENVRAYSIPNGDIDQVRNQANLRAGWSEAYDSWEDRQQSSQSPQLGARCRVHCWLWQRALTQ